MEFLDVDTVENARAKLLASVKGWLPALEALPLRLACGRVLAEDVFAQEGIPSFRRSTVDGYAVFSADTAAAGDSIPVLLAEKGKVDMGKPAAFALSHGPLPSYSPTTTLTPLSFRLSACACP